MLAEREDGVRIDERRLDKGRVLKKDGDNELVFNDPRMKHSSALADSGQQIVLDRQRATRRESRRRAERDPQRIGLDAQDGVIAKTDERAAILEAIRAQQNHGGHQAARVNLFSISLHDYWGSS